MKIKICGITNLEDALVAIDSGADMLGFNFYSKSPRYLTPEACTKIQSSIINRQSLIVTVGVFVNSPVDEIVATLDHCGLHLAQLSGDEPASDLEKLGQRAYKALRLRDPQLAAALVASLPPRAEPPACLLDGHIPGQYGGTGQTADWSLAASLARKSPILLAGGLTPVNVSEAVRQVFPWGVDVASGVEAAPGKKDAGKVRQFIQNARQADCGEVAPVVVVSKEDLPEILALQKLAYRSEAELNNDFSIPPMMQTAEAIATEFEQRTFLKVVLDGRIVGSVRGHLADGTCYIGRVIVHPDCQNRGIGTQLMGAIEAGFGGARRFELFTGERSARNLYLYQKLGYRIFKRERLSEKVGLVYLEKRNDPS